MRTVRKAVKAENFAEIGFNTVFANAGSNNAFNIYEGANASILRAGAGTQVNIEGASTDFSARIIGRTLVLKDGDNQIRISLSANLKSGEALELSFLDGGYKVYFNGGWKIEGAKATEAAKAGQVKALSARELALEELDSIEDMASEDGSFTEVFPSEYTITASQIATANATGANGAPVLIKTADTGTAAIVLQTNLLTADQGFVIEGNANLSIQAGAQGDTILVAGNGNNSIDSGAGHDDVRISGNGNNTVVTGSGSDDVTIYGNGNNTVVTGEGDDYVEIVGSGSNTVTTGAGNDILILGSGNDVIIVGLDDFAVGEYIDGGAGIDILRITGDNDFTHGTLKNIEFIDIQCVVSFSIDQLAGVQGITGDTTTVINLTAAQPGSDVTELDLSAMSLSGIKELNVGNGVEVRLSAEQIAAIDTFTVGAGATIYTDEAGARLLAEKGITASVEAGSYSLQDATLADLAGKAGFVYELNVSAEEAFDQLFLDGQAAAQLTDDGATVFINGVASAAQAEALADAPVKLGNQFAVADTAANIAEALANGFAGWLNADDITSLTLTSAATVEQAEEIFKANGSLQQAVADAKADAADDQVITLPAYTIADSAANIANALRGATPEIVEGAASITLTTALTAAQAEDVLPTLGGKLVGGYSLTGNAADLAGLSSSIRNGATDITVTGPASVAEATKIENASNSGTNTYDLVDTAAALFAASAAVLGAASAVQISGDSALTLAQANKLATYLADDYGWTLKDTAANLTSPAALALIEKFDGLTVQPTTALTLAQAGILDAADATLADNLSISDSAANLLAALTAEQTDALGNNPQSTEAAEDALALIQSVLDTTGTLTVTGSMTVEQLEALVTVVQAPFQFSLADTAENLADVDAAVVTAATTVTVTTPATAAEAAELAAIDRAGKSPISYSISDSLANIAAQLPGNANALTAATTIVVTDATVSAADALKVVALNAALQTKLAYAVEDNVAGLEGAITAEQLQAATSVTLKGNTADEIRLFAEANAAKFAQVDSYSISVASTGLLADIGIAGTYYNNAAAIEVTDELSLAEATNALVGLTDAHKAKLVFAELLDAAFNLKAAVGDAAKAAVVAKAASVWIASKVSVADAKAIAGLLNADASLTIQVLEDSVANLLLAGDLLADANGVEVTGTASVDELQQLLALGVDADELTVEVSDTIDAIQNASPEFFAAIGGDVTVTLKAGTELALSVAQVDALDGAIASITDANGDAVTYEIVDSIENLINAMQSADAAGSLLTGATSIIATGGVVVTDEAFPDNSGDSYIDALDALVALPNFDSVNSTFSIRTGVAEALDGAAGSATAALEYAASVEITDAVTVEQAGKINAANANVTFASLEDALVNLFNGTAEDGYTLKDGVAELIAKAGNKVVLTGDSLDAAEAAAVVAALGADVAVSYELEDSAENLAANTDLLANATDIDVDGDATVAQIEAIKAAATGLGEGESISYTLKDTAAALVAADAATLLEADSPVVIDGPATVAQAIVIESLANVDGYVRTNILDTAANVVDGLQALEDAGFNLNAWNSITLTSSVTVAQAAALSDFYGNDAALIKTAAAVAGTPENVTGLYLADTAANLLKVVVIGSGIAHVTITDALSVSKLAQIQDLLGNPGTPLSYSISDALAYIVAAFADENAELLAGAESVTVAGVGSIDVVERDGEFFVQGNASELAALPQALLEVGYIVKDSVANYSDAANVELVDGAASYVLVDTAANLLAAGLDVTVGAAEVEVTDVIDAATLAELQTLGLKLGAVAGVTASAADLANAVLTGPLLEIGTITVTDASITLAQAAAIDGLGAGDVYTLSDAKTAIDFIEAGGYDQQELIENAQSVTVTGALSYVEAGLLKSWNGNATFSVSIADAQENAVLALLQKVQEVAALSIPGQDELSAEEQSQIDALMSATSVSLVDNTVSVALAAELVKLPGFTGGYVLSDSAANLAAADAALLAGATTVKVNAGNATVAEAAVLVNLANIEKVGGNGADAALAKVSIVDTAKALAGASAADLAKASGVAIDQTGTANDVSAAEAKALQALIADASITQWGTKAFDVVDTQAAIVDPLNASGVSKAATVTVTGDVTLAQARAVVTAATVAAAVAEGAGIDFELKDTRSALQSATATEAKMATKVTVSDNVSATQAGIINDIFGANKVAFAGTVTGTAAQLTESLVGQAAKVDITDSLSVEAAQEFLELVGDKLVGGYTITDTVDNLVNAALNHSFSNAIVSNATSVSLEGGAATMNIAAATVITALNFSGAYSLADTATAIAGASVALINGATLTTVTLEAGISESFDATAYTSKVVVDASQAGIAELSGNIFTLTDVDTLSLKSATSKTSLGDALELGDGEVSFELHLGYQTGSGFVLNPQAGEQVLVTFGNAPKQAVLLDGNNLALKIEDTYVFVGTTENDSIDVAALELGNVKTLVVGGAGDDTITGGAGDDIINGGAGTDTINVGAGIDTVVLGTVTAAGVDVVTGIALGDSIKFFDSTDYLDASATDFDTGNATLADALADVAAAAKSDSGTDSLGYAVGFTYGGNQYVYIDGANDGYAAGDDAVVQLVGTDLSTLNGTTFIA